jgi:acetyl esterase/lipase
MQTITYRTINDSSLEMDICLPEGTPGPRPGVLFIHGGGWSGGRRAQFTWHIHELARHGFVAASASYRLSAVARYPAALDDVQCAMRWLRAHAQELQLDPARLGAFGGSAGGHLVACLGTRETRSDCEPALRGFSSRAQCVVDVHGIHDFHALRDIADLEPSVLRFLGAKEENADAWTDASPIHFVDADTAPMFLAHDPADATVPYGQTVLFAAALVKAARPVEFLPTPGSGHGYCYTPDNPWTLKLWPRTVAWLTGWLKP